MKAAAGSPPVAPEALPLHIEPQPGGCFRCSAAMGCCSRGGVRGPLHHSPPQRAAGAPHTRAALAPRTPLPASIPLQAARARPHAPHWPAHPFNHAPHHGTPPRPPAHLCQHVQLQLCMRGLARCLRLRARLLTLHLQRAAGCRALLRRMLHDGSGLLRCARHLRRPGPLCACQWLAVCTVQGSVLRAWKRWCCRAVSCKVASQSIAERVMRARDGICQYKEPEVLQLMGLQGGVGSRRGALLQH